MGVKLWYIGSIRDATGLATGRQCEHPHERHNAFNEILESIPVFAQQDVYTFDVRARETLTDGIMAMTHTKTGRQLFHSLNQPRGPDSTYRLSYILSHSEEAAHQRVTWVYKYFAIEDVFKALSCHWDMVTTGSNQQRRAFKTWTTG
jgi:hypothetical protein